jgi:hypothetical protein
MTQVVAVADHAGRQAAFAARLSAAFAAAGLPLQLRTHRELAAEVSVELRPGQPPAVTPDRPLLWLSPGDTGWPATPDGRFLAAEALAAARSIAFLTRSPVLNRPSAVSLCGTLPPASARAVRGARHLDPAAVRAERFAGTWPPEAAGAGPLEVYDYATSRGSYGPPSSPAGPFRYRADPRPARRVKVLVAGDLAVAPAGVGPGILDASRRVAAWYQLDLATVWWLAGPHDGAHDGPADGPHGGSRTLARVDGWEWGAGEDAAAVAAAVAAWMAGRLGRPAEVDR